MYSRTDMLCGSLPRASMDLDFCSFNLVKENAPPKKDASTPTSLQDVFEQVHLQYMNLIACGTVTCVCVAGTKHCPADHRKRIISKILWLKNVVIW